MRITEKRLKRIRTAALSFIIICLTPLCESGRLLNGAGAEDVFTGREIRCAIDLGNDMYGKHGLETGMYYELLHKFADDNRCSISIVTSHKGENYLDSLRMGHTDIVITHSTDLKNGILSSRQMECTRWVVDSTSEAALSQINRWISHITGTDGYKAVKDRFTGCSNPVVKAGKGLVSDHLSPYDQLISKYASQLGWDWRMLAAVIYQESRFSIASRSSRGAEGLMQVMPQTASSYGISDLTDPEMNIIAGTNHLKRLQSMFRKYDMSPDELVKFTLAAYNAGEGRIIDCRNLASSLSMDCNRWADITKVIPMMREDSILEEDSVKLGKFYGFETIQYVENVMTIYDAFCRLCPERII